MADRVVTASDEVAHTYYGLPVIKAPHWRWLVIGYFFLGAVAGGSFTIATLADLVSKDRALVRAGRYLSLVAVIPSPILLALDLGRPERAFHMFRILKLRSPMSLGSWALLFLGLFSGLLASLQLLVDLTKRSHSSLERVLGLLGLPFSIFVAGYTGLLLAITNVPLWARNYLLMGPTFLASAFSTSLAALSLVLSSKEGPETARALARTESICLAAELSLLLAGVVRLGRLGRPLTSPPLGLIFWPVTMLGGIVTPLVLQLAGPARGRPAPLLRRTITSLLVLSGGFTLRMLMIFAGRRSVADPEYYFEFTRGRDPGARSA